jgi:acetate kinase
MNGAVPRILTINGGSSSIKFALFATFPSLQRVLKGAIRQIGPHAALEVLGQDEADTISRPVVASDYKAAVAALLNWISNRRECAGLAAVGHRVVHGGQNFSRPERVTTEMLDALRQLSPFDPEHMPLEILLIEAFRLRFRDLQQVACFDTAFHHNLPNVARLLPIPRRYEAQGIRRYGFHGLSYAFLMEELARLDGETAARGRVILAHLGSGASLAAVQDGHSIDTSMSFTPAAGVPMSTRSGDLDPGLFSYLAQCERMSAKQFDRMVNFESGLLGMSETSSDIQELLLREPNDIRAADAIALFCYQIRKWIGAFAAALGGLDTLVFAGGIGENSATIRTRICAGLDFLGITLNRSPNALNAPLISTDTARVKVRVIHTDEEREIAKSVASILNLGSIQEPRP